MQLFVSIFNKALRQSIAVLGLMLFISLSGLFFCAQPCYAVPFTTEKPISPSEQLTPEEKIDRAYEYNRAAGIREEDRQQAYEQAVKDSETPEEKIYERNVKDSQPDLIEKAKELVDQVTGK
ncbi:hypothetical protein SD81_029245 [Tolypothrix campylonemoides VB511288]|nr:hypothetical protein SD81_029245 [Tolypothrix campylonemoides VB511288]